MPVFPLAGGVPLAKWVLPSTHGQPTPLPLPGGEMVSGSALGQLAHSVLNP